MKALRLFTAPIQLLSNYQDRLTKKLEAVRTTVPTEKQVESPAEICGPIIENLKYVKEGSYLEAFYLNLLKRSIDHDRVSEAHPAFIKIIEQLSRDEAYILSKMKKELVWTEYECELKNGIYKNVKAINFSFDHQELYFPEHFKVYIEHMQFLNLFYIRNDGLIKIENGISIRRNNYEVSGSANFL